MTREEKEALVERTFWQLAVAQISSTARVYGWTHFKHCSYTYLAQSYSLDGHVARTLLYLAKVDLYTTVAETLKMDRSAAKRFVYAMHYRST